MEFCLSNLYRTIKAPRLLLRPIDLKIDAPILYKISNGEPYEGYPAYDKYRLIWEYLQYRPLSPQIKGFIDYIDTIKSNPDHHIFTIELNNTNKPIGLVYIHLNYQTKEVYTGGMWISPIFKKQKYGFSAFHALVKNCFENGTETLTVAALPVNSTSITWFKSLGFLAVEGFTVFSPLHEEYRHLVVFKSTREQWNSFCKTSTLQDLKFEN